MKCKECSKVMEYQDGRGIWVCDCGNIIMCQGIIEALDEINKMGKVSDEKMINLKKELAMMIAELI